MTDTRMTAHIAIAACLLGAPTLAHGQDAPQEESERGENAPIIVTAQRREQLLQETPVTVTALGTAQLEDRGIEEVLDLARTVPNLQLLPVTANPSTLQVGLRGGSEQTGGLITSEPPVGIYVDDVYRARLQGSNAQLDDIERVEVLRGPQGTLYGRNSFSGAIKVITRTPSDGNEWTTASLGYGAFDEIRASASAGRALTDNLGGSIAVFYRQADGFIFNRARNEMVGAEENFAIRGKLAFESGPLEVVAAASYSADDNDGYIATAALLPRIPTGRADFVTTGDATPRFGDDPYVTEYPQETFGETKTLALSLDVSYDFDWGTIRSISGFVDLSDKFRWDLVGGFQPTPGVFSPGFDRESDADVQQFTQELQLLGESGDGRLNWIVGLFYFREEGDQSLDDDIPIFGLGDLEPTFLDIETDSYAIFAQLDYALTDKLTIIAGARYTEDRKRFDADLQVGFPDPTDPTDPTPRLGVSLDETFDAFTPKIGLDYRFSDDVFAYASVSRGFKAGGFNGLAVLNPVVFQTVYGPQTVWAYEGGLKTQFAQGRATANVAVFYNDISGLQQTALIPPASFPTQNVGDAGVFGIELELAAEPVDGLNLFANIGYQDGDYKSLVPEAQAASAGATDLPLVTDWTAQGGFTYTAPLSDDFDLRFGADAAYTGDNFVEVTNSLLVEGYTRVNAFAAITTSDGRWELQGQVQNLTDEANYVSGIVTVPVPGLTILKPRTWLVSLRYAM